MLRIIGSVMVLTACAWAGFSAADRLRRRRDFLTSFITSLTVMQTEIVFGRRALAEIFRGLDREGRLYGFYGSCAGAVAEKGIRRAWNEAVDRAAARAALTAGDIDVLRSVGAELGMSDIDGQTRTIKRASELLSANAAEAGESYARLAKMYRGCGALSGIFAVLMLM